MHKHVTFHGSSTAIRVLARDLVKLEGVIAVDHQPHSSLKPAGDVLRVHVLNRDADRVLQRARPFVHDQTAPLTVGIGQSTALIDPTHAALIEADADEMLWEEMESDLRNHGRISFNFLLLMALGGSIASAGLTMEPEAQSIAFVGASIIAPAFEPVAKLTQGLVLRNFQVCGRALRSLAIGYGILFLAALLVAYVLSQSHQREMAAALLAQPTAAPLTHMQSSSLVASACAAVAGIIMVVSLRDLYVVGPLMVLVIIHGLAFAASAVALGVPRAAGSAMGRVGLDVLLIVVLGGAVFYWKQRSFHRRQPLT